MNLLSSQNGGKNVSLGGVWTKVILKDIFFELIYHLDLNALVEKAAKMVKKAKKKNKTAQETDRVERDLTILEENLGLKAECWKAEQIMALLLVLESNTRSGEKIVINSLERKFILVKSIFAARGHPISSGEQRKVRMALNVHIQERLDEPDLPTTDGTSPMLSPVQWVAIQTWLSEEASTTTENFLIKKHMALVSIAFGFSTGMRLAEMHRLKYSDLNLNGKNEIKIRIRRSKSNRRGHKKVWQIAPAFQREPLLCPVRTLWNYIHETKKIMYPGAYIFSDDLEGKQLTNKENITRWWRMGAKGAGLPKESWPMAHSHHCTKINMGKSLGYTTEEISDAMNWCHSSVIEQYLRKVNEKKEGIAYHLTSISAQELTEATYNLWE